MLSVCLDFTSYIFRCQWNKKWFPYKDTLPECKITDCVKPFKIPEDSFLQVTFDTIPEKLTGLYYFMNLL